ncbi:hypothetical protein HN011_003428 [Eciton burchellii]|nr:hypothetical protein HN011_003428 [Eciton burchellii]
MSPLREWRKTRRANRSGWELRTVVLSIGLYFAAQSAVADAHARSKHLSRQPEEEEGKVIGTSDEEERVEEEQRDYAGYASMMISVRGSTYVFLPAIAQQRGKQ